MNVYHRFNILLRIARVARNLSTIKRETQNHYEILGLEPTATQLDIKNSYFEKTKLYHPDVVGSNEANLKKFRQISEAYEVLGSPAARKDYDERVLGLTKHDTEYEDGMGDNRMRTSRGRNDESEEWIRNYTNELRQDEYISKTIPKSISDFSYVPFQYVPPSKYQKFNEHRLTKFIAGLIIFIVLLGSNNSEPFYEYILGS